MVAAISPLETVTDGNRAPEYVGVGVAVLAHVLLFVALSLTVPDDVIERETPMAVELVTEAAPVSTAPEPSDDAPAPTRGEPDVDTAASVAPPTPEIAPVLPPPPPPPPRVEPRPTPRVITPRVTPPRVTPPRMTPPRAPAATTPPRTTTATPRTPSRPPPRTPTRTGAPARTGTDPRPSGSLDDIANSVARAGSGRAANPPAERSGAQIRQSISVSINGAVQRPWNTCRVSGAEVERLRTTVAFRLLPTGGLDRIVSVNTTGVTDSNRPQLQRFEECARRAIQLAAPFTLPRENFDYWQNYTLDFEKG